MTSLLTNTASMSTLRLMTQTSKDIGQTEAQASSGLRVANASDNAAYWSIGVAMKSQLGALSEVQTGLSLTSSIANVTAVALVSIRTSLEKMQADLVTARQEGVSLSAMQTDISAQQRSILDATNSANFNGVNWLINRVASDTTTTTVVNADVSQDDYKKIALGQEPGASSTFDSAITAVSTQTKNGVSSSQTSTSGWHTTRVDAQDGTVTTVKVPTTSQSGSFQVDDAVVPVSISMDQGLVTSSFSLSPLELFSDFSGKTNVSTTITYGGTVITNMHTSDTSATTHSYEEYVNPYSSGILDGTIYLPPDPTDSSSRGSSSSNGSVPVNIPVPLAPQTIYTPDFSGGDTSSTQPVSSGYSGSSGYAAGNSGGQTIQENILTMNIADASVSDLTVLEQGVQTAMERIINASAVVGALQNRMDSQKSFNNALSDALTSGVGSLQDADMNIVSTRLQALQTQQQLQTQSLSIANQNTSIILKLFAS